MDAGEWYIEVNGRKVGPFTLDQVRGLLDDGEIRPYHQVTSVLTGGQWISVEEALQETLHGAPAGHPAEIPDVTTAQILDLSVNQSASPSSRAATAPGEFSPPPRPELTSSGPIEDQADPALSLFDALQIEKERRTTIRPLSGNSAGRRKPLFRMPNVAAQIAAVKQVKFAPKIGGVSITPRMFWTAVFAGLVLGSLTYGVMRAFKHHAPPQSGSFTPYQSRFGEQSVPTVPAHQPLRPITRPVVIPPRRGRTIPPPPPPAHVANPPRGNDNGGEYSEPPRDENNPDNGYPPQDNDGGVNGGNGAANGATNGQRTNNPANNGYPPSDNGDYDGEPGQNQQGGGGEQQGEPGANQQDPNAQNPDANGMPPANAPGQDSFRPTQNGGGQPQAYPGQ